MANSTDISLTQAIRHLGMGEDSQGFRWVSEKEEEQDSYIYLGLEQAERFGAKAVYFRFFEDNAHPPRPQVYIYESSEIGGGLTFSSIHHHLWNAGTVPYCFIYNGSEIYIYNCGIKPDWDLQTAEFTTPPHDVINFAAEVQDKLRQYHARQFDSGLFWDSDLNRKFKYDQSAYEQLLNQLKNVKSHIIEEVGQQHAALVKRVLMMLILIKYLEERKDENGNGALNPIEFYSKYNDSNPSLVGVLKDAQTFSAMLRDLSSKEHFNGQIFSLNSKEQECLGQINLEVFRHFVLGDASILPSAKYGLGQMSLWRLYQFNYLPIELISHIYEDFLADENGTKKKGVVYTPPYLVQFLIDQCMPLEAPKKNYKVLDPACGSGIFLVGAFKRMIQWWRVTNNFAKPTKSNIEELKALLQNNIYGCDIEGEAVTLSYFSLGLALLDALSPKEIWKNVHFDNLVGKNLLHGDFFKILSNSSLGHDFDLIIGNPPFEERFSAHASIIDEKSKFEIEGRPIVPQNQIALLFLEQSLGILKDSGETCLVLPSGPMLYNTKTHPFRSYLFDQYFFDTIYDFTPLRAKLFTGSSSSAKPAVVAVRAKAYKPHGLPLKHLIFRRTKASSEKIEFELDYYDIHQVPYQIALTKPQAWQANFMGGGRLYQLLDKLTGHQVLRDYLLKMKDENGWVFGEGWQEAASSKPIRRLKELSAKIEKSEAEKAELKLLETKHTAPWITGKKMMATNGTLTVCDKTYFQWPRNPKLFDPPHLLVKESVNGKQIPAYFFDEHITFKAKIFGIHAPDRDKRLLLDLQKYLKNNDHVPLMWLLSGQVLTSREGVPLMKDILALPYPSVPFNLIERIILQDILDYYAEFRTQGEKSVILDSVSSSELEEFGKVFTDILNTVYKTITPHPPSIGHSFIAYPFFLGDTPEMDLSNDIDKMEISLARLINHRHSESLWIKRIIKVYHRNVIILYKPNQKRYWLKSIAVRDADETFGDLYKQGK